MVDNKSSKIYLSQDSDNILSKMIVKFYGIAKQLPFVCILQHIYFTIITNIITIILLYYITNIIIEKFVLNFYFKNWQANRVNLFYEHLG